MAGGGTKLSRKRRRPPQRIPPVRTAKTARASHTTVRLPPRVRAVLRAKAKLWKCTQTTVIISAILSWRAGWEPDPRHPGSVEDDNAAGD